MTTRAQFLRDWGQVILISCAIGGGALTFTAKATAWFQAGPVALTKAEKLERDVRVLKRRSGFMIRAVEKISKEKYDWRGESRDEEAAE